MDPDFVTACLDEIALEGLDGITLSSLWVRLKNRNHFSMPLDERSKAFLWKRIAVQPEVGIYILPCARTCIPEHVQYHKRHEPCSLGRVSKSEQMAAHASYDDIYPLSIVSDNGIRGSCATYLERQCVTDQIQDADDEELLIQMGEACKKWGECLVLVGSQELRFRSLCGLDVDPCIPLSDIQYCILERVGRSRYMGETVKGKVSLGVFGLPPKIMFYHRRFMLSKRLMRKQAHISHDQNNKQYHSVLLHLTRFYQRYPGAYEVALEKVCNFLQKQKNWLYPVRTCRETLGIDDKSFKKLYQMSAKYVTTYKALHRDIFPNAPEMSHLCKNNTERRVLVIKLITAYKASEYDDNDDDDNEEVDDDNDDYDESDAAKSNEKDDGDHAQDAEDTGENKVTHTRIRSKVTKFGHRDLFIERPVLDQIYKVFREAGPRGLTQSDVAYIFHLERLESRLICRNLQRLCLIKSIMIDQGKQRTAVFIAADQHDDCTFRQNLEHERFRMQEFWMSRPQRAGSKLKDGNLQITLGRNNDSRSGETTAVITELIVPPPRQSHQSIEKSCFINQGLYASARLSSPSAHLTCRLLRRANFIISAVREAKLIDNLHLLVKKIIEDESKISEFEGRIDRKSLIRLIEKLAKEGQVRSIKTVIKVGKLEKELHFICDPSISPSDPIVRSAIEQARMKNFLVSKEAVRDLRVNPSDRNIKSESLSRRQVSDDTSGSPRRMGARQTRRKPDDMVYDPSCIRKYGMVCRYQRSHIVHHLIWYLVYGYTGEYTEPAYNPPTDCHLEHDGALHNEHNTANKDIANGSHHEPATMATMSDLQICDEISPSNKLYAGIYDVIDASGILSRSDKAPAMDDNAMDMDLHNGVPSDTAHISLKQRDKIDASSNVVGVTSAAITVVSTETCDTGAGTTRVEQQQAGDTRTSQPVDNDNTTTNMTEQREGCLEAISETRHDDCQPHMSTVEEIQHLIEPPVYHDETSWKRFLPPLPMHKSYPLGWCLLSDVLLGLPLHIFCQLISIPYRIPGLMEMLTDPIKRFYPLSCLPIKLMQQLLYGRRYIFAFHSICVQLCHLGLLSFGHQKLKEKDQVFVYIHKKACVIDTTSSERSYIYIKNAPPGGFPVHCHVLETEEDLNKYWFDLQNIALNTSLGHYGVRQFHKETLVIHTGLEDAQLPKTPETIQDDGSMAGDGRGACGMDSSLFIHLQRNWLTSTADRKLWKSRDLWACLDSAVAQPPNKNRLPRLIDNETLTLVQTNIEKKPCIVALSTVPKTQGNRGGRGLKRRRPMESIMEPKMKFRRTKQINTPKTKWDWSYHEEQDRIAELKKKKERVQWTQQEDSVLLLAKVASMFLCTYPRIILVPWGVIRDILHSKIDASSASGKARIAKYSQDKTSHACQRRVSFALKNPQTQYNLSIFLEEAKQDEDLVREYKKRRYKYTDHEESEKAFKGLMEKLIQKFSSGQYEEKQSLPLSMTALQSMYNVKVIGSLTNITVHQDVGNIREIQHSVLHNLIHSFVSLSDKQPRAHEMYNLFNQYPEQLLIDVFSQMRQDGIITKVKKDKRCIGRPTTFFAMNSHQLSQRYAYSFVSRYPTAVFEEAKQLLEQLWGSFAEFEGHDRVNLSKVDTGGHCATVISLTAMRMLSFDITVPENIIVLDTTSLHHGYPVGRGKCPPALNDTLDADDESSEDDTELKELINLGCGKGTNQLTQSSQQTVHNDKTLRVGQPSTSASNTAQTMTSSPINTKLVSRGKGKGVGKNRTVLSKASEQQQDVNKTNPVKNGTSSETVAMDSEYTQLKASETETTLAENDEAMKSVAIPKTDSALILNNACTSNAPLKEGNNIAESVPKKMSSLEKQAGQAPVLSSRVNVKSSQASRMYLALARNQWIRGMNMKSLNPQDNIVIHSCDIQASLKNPDSAPNTDVVKWMDQSNQLLTSNSNVSTNQASPKKQIVTTFDDENGSDIHTRLFLDPQKVKEILRKQQRLQPFEVDLPSIWSELEQELGLSDFELCHAVYRAIEQSLAMGIRKCDLQKNFQTGISHAIAVLLKRQVTGRRRRMGIPPTPFTPTPTYPCIVCKVNCVTNSIFCGCCGRWVHYKCENLSIGEATTLSKIKNDYLCIKCTHTDGKFDYKMAHDRLTTAATKSYRILQSAVVLEQILLRSSREFKSLTQFTGDFELDVPSKCILVKVGQASYVQPIRVTADGNCLFNAISMLVSGDEASSLELRIRTAMEMVAFEQHYREKWENSAVHLVSPNYSVAAIDCCTDGRYSSAWTMMAAASVVHRDIRSIYPAVNGQNDKNIGILNVTFAAREPLDGNEELPIMWTSCSSVLPKVNAWRPNHFAPLRFNRNTDDTPRKRSYSEVLQSPPQSHSLTEPPCKNYRSSAQSPREERQVSTPMEKSDAVNVTFDVPVSPVSFEVSGPELPPTSRRIGLPAFPQLDSSDSETSPSTPKPKRNAFKNTISSPESPPSPPLRQLDSSESETSELKDSVGLVNRSDNVDGNPSFTAIEALKPLTVPGKFLAVGKLFTIICETNCSEPVIPRGKKENVFVVVDNSNNTDMRQKGDKRDFADDCGVWDGAKGTTANSHFVLANGQLKLVVLKNCVYCTQHRVDSKTTWLPIDPQPASSSIIKMHRYYTKLKGDNNYKKRVTIFEQLPDQYDDKKNFAIVEYCGIITCHRPHGNSKKDAPYERTRPAILECAGKEAISKPPMTVYQEMAKNDSIDAPKTFRQIRDKKYRESKKNDNYAHRQNLADEVLEVIGKVNTHPYVQLVICTKGKPPSVIMYSTEQLKDMKRNVIGNNASVIGIDRTFNLGACFVTTTVYKSKTVVSRESGQSPIMLGPIFLHWDSIYESYHLFLSHVKAVLGTDLDLLGIRLGSDEEKSLTKAIHSCFPNAKHFLCTKHLKDNVKCYLMDKVGCSTKDRHAITELLFGQHGVAKSNDSCIFDERIHNIATYFDKYPAFESYFKKRLRGLISDNVCVPMQAGTDGNDLWTNNNSESLNNILKLATGWKPQKLPVLVDKSIII